MPLLPDLVVLGQGDVQEDERRHGGLRPQGAAEPADLVVPHPAVAADSGFRVAVGIEKAEQRGRVPAARGLQAQAVIAGAGNPGRPGPGQAARNLPLQGEQFGAAGVAFVVMVAEHRAPAQIAGHERRGGVRPGGAGVPGAVPAADHIAGEDHQIRLLQVEHPLHERGGAVVFRLTVAEMGVREPNDGEAALRAAAQRAAHRRPAGLLRHRPSGSAAWPPA